MHQPHSDRPQGPADGGSASTSGAMLPAVYIAPPTQGAMPAANALPSTLDPMVLVGGLKRRWLSALLLGLLLGTTAAAGVWFFVPVKQTVQALIEVAPVKPSILDKEIRADSQSYQRKQTLLAIRPQNLVVVLRDPQINGLSIFRKNNQVGQEIEWLQSQLKADYPVPEILSISMTGEDTDDMIKIVDAVTKAYLSEVNTREQGETIDHKAKLEPILVRSKSRLDSQRDNLRSMALAVGSNNKDAQAHILKFKVDSLNKVQQELLQVTSDIRRLEVQLKSEKATAEGAASEILTANARAIEDRVSKDPYIVRYQAEIEAAKELLADIQGRLKPEYREKDGSVAKLRKTLDDLHKSVKERRDKVKPQIEGEILEQVQNQAKSRIASLQNQIVAWNELKRILEGEKDAFKVEVREVGKNTVGMDELKENIAHLEKVTGQLQERMQLLDVETQAPSRLKIMEQAFVRGGRDDNKKAKIAGVAGLSGLLLGLFSLSWLEVRGRRVASADTIKQTLGLRLMGTLPALENKARRGSQKAAYAKDLLMESVDAMRTMLLHIAHQEGLKSVMVTSATGGEGKTSLSCHLAASLARAGCRTLLLDGDLRRPATHRLFGMPNERGFADVLRGDAALDEVVQTTPMDNLWIVTAGKADPATIQFLAQKKGEAVFQQLKEEYDFVVVDTPPVLPVADSLLIGKYVDGVVISMLRDVSRMPAVCSATERITQLGIRVLGAVLSGVQSDQYGSSYHYAVVETAQSAS